MGSFSFTRADKTTKRSNLTMGDRYKILIPQEFGGGFIMDTYYDYGYVFYNDDTRENADLYGILAYWNKCEGMIFDGEEYPSTMEDILSRGQTHLQNNRYKGIKISCYDKDIDNLKYPLKLVSASYKGTYEECDMRSYNDPTQGWQKTYWEQEDITQGEDKLFDVALREKEFEYGLERNDVIDLFDMLNGEEAYPIEIYAKYHECSAMGFITAEAADSLDYEYEGSGLNDFVAEILDDMANETEDCIYKFRGLKIWLSR